MTSASTLVPTRQARESLSQKMLFWSSTKGVSRVEMTSFSFKIGTASHEGGGQTALCDCFIVCEFARLLTHTNGEHLVQRGAQVVDALAVGKVGVSDEDLGDGNVELGEHEVIDCHQATLTSRSTGWKNAQRTPPQECAQKRSVSCCVDGMQSDCALHTCSCTSVSGCGAVAVGGAVDE